MSFGQSPKAKRCTVHSINFPPYTAKCVVRGCEEALWPTYVDGPDEDWRELVDALNSDISLEQPEDEINHTLPHRFDAKARIYTGKDGMLWVTHAELLYNGYRAVQDGTIVFLNGEFYEISGYIEKAGSWWVQKVEIDGAADSLEPHMFLGDPAP